MRVVVFTSDSGGCGHYRLRWPAEALATAGYEVRVSKKNPAVVTSQGRVVGLAENLKADIAVFQRPCRRQYVELFECLQKEGIKIVVDMDDDLTNIHRNNPAYGPYNYIHLPNMHWEFGSKACEMADYVTVTTKQLQTVYGGTVVPNCIPSAYLDFKRPENELVTVGWAGHVATHPDDLQVTHGAVNQALTNTKGLSRFLALGDAKTLENLSIRNREPNSWLPGVPLSQYAEFVSQLDIGIVPLTDSLFNQAKSYLKALEYASLGVVPVVSPTADNMRLVEMGAAVAAHSPKDWIREIESLIRDGERRQELSAKAREVASTLTIEGNTSKWAEGWGII